MSISRPPTTPMRKALFRAPIWVYRLGLGPLMGRRFVLLTHKGRTSGRARQAVLEVIGSNEATGTVLVASGYGHRSQWYRNILAEPRVMFQVGAQRHRGRAVPLPPEEAGPALAHYAQRHPAAARALLGGLGFEVDGSPESFARVGTDPDGIPVVRLAPTDPPRSDFPDLSDQ